MDINTLQKLRGLQPGRHSVHTEQKDLSFSVSDDQNNSAQTLPQTPVSFVSLDEKNPKGLEQNLPEIQKTESLQHKNLTQSDLAQIIRQARGIGVSSSTVSFSSSHDNEKYSFITPDMIDENGYLKMSEEEQKKLIEGIYEFFKSGLESNNPETSDE